MTTTVSAILEISCLAKGPAGEGEDALAIAIADGAVRFAGVVDGVTDKSGRSYGTDSGGRLAAKRVAAALCALAADATADQAVSAATIAVAELRDVFGVPDGDPTPPAAGFAILSVQRREIWRVGDANVAWTSGLEWVQREGETLLDKAAATVRAVYLTALLEQGADPTKLTATDPGREVILPMLQMQGMLANRDAADPLGYGVIDGTQVPPRHIEVFALPDAACEVVMVTDGYLSAAPTLQAAEAELRLSLVADPLRIKAHRATKAVRPGAESFDDRSYVRVQLTARPREGLS
ncbi:hypothetical protein ACF1GY_05585 [Streptomyces sp. NPDC014684]|uniref:hypothetical protein n=1 Tax=Streptomyces sp. NPDC014684 TaxID=3364880 RepID=UPI0036FAA7AB